MKTFSAEESLWLALPILIVVLGLASAIILFQNNGGEIRSKASEPKTVTPITPSKPEIVCTSMYQPVCGSDNNTYSNACEAGLLGIFSTTPGTCSATTPAILPSIRE